MLHDCLYLKFKNRWTNLQWEPQRFERRQLTVVRLPRRGRKDVLGWQKWFIGLSGSIRYISVYWVFIKIQTVLLWSVHFTACKKRKANWELCVSRALSTGGFHCRKPPGLLHQKVSNGHDHWIFLALQAEARVPVFGESNGKRITHYADCHLILLFSAWYPCPSAGFSVLKSSVKFNLSNN